MERKDFLKNGFGFLGMALISPSLLTSGENNSAHTQGEASCALANQETAGPFPTITLKN